MNGHAVLVRLVERSSLLDGLSIHAGFQHNLNAVVLPVFEHLIGPRCIIQTHAMRYHEARIDITVFYHCQQRPHVPLHMSLPCLDRQRSIHHRTHRKLVDKSAIHPYYRDRTAAIDST